MERPADVVDFEPSREHFPFESRWFASSAGSVHYIDEGEGRPLLLLHGNPDWSFLYRKVVLGLRGQFRCIAPDYPGFGLSAHPEGYGYTPGEHAAVVRELVEHLDLRDMVVMGQDWGGPIGMDLASRLPERVHGLVMANTWFWPADAPMFKAFSLLMGSPPLQRLILRRNLFVDVAMRRLVRAPLSEEEFEHYRAVVPTAASRAGIAAFPRELRGAREWLTELERRATARLADTPLKLVWGTKDRALGSEAVLRRWRRSFPQATVRRVASAGHYIQEDAPEQIVWAIAEAYGPTGG